jgi:hypothetical protein
MPQALNDVNDSLVAATTGISARTTCGDVDGVGGAGVGGGIAAGDVTTEEAGAGGDVVGLGWRRESMGRQ